MKDKFYQWMLNIEKKSHLTSKDYSYRLDKISEHYSTHKGIHIDIYKIDDLKILEEIRELYSLNGKYSEFGNKSKGCIRNSISTYVRYIKSR